MEHIEIFSGPTLNGIWFAGFVFCCVVAPAIPHFLRKHGEDSYHLQHMPSDHCPDCEDQP